MNTNLVTKFSAVTLVAVVISSVMLGSVSGHDTISSPLDSPTPKQVRSSAEIWEYKVSQLVHNSSELEAELNKLGAEGWELIHIHGMGLAVFKRKNQMSAATPDSQVPADQSVWHGDWDTNWGPMTISVAANGTVTGTYGAAKHSILAAVDPESLSVLSGKWAHSDSNLAGTFRFEISHQNQFKGCWAFGDEVLNVDIPNWVGKKALPTSIPR